VSFCGSDFGKYEYYHFNLNIYREIANSFCQSLEDYYDPTQAKVKKAVEELENYARNPRLDESGKNTEDSDYSGDENEIVEN
jgi:cytosolic carboxypeptidase protein 2/3